MPEPKLEPNEFATWKNLVSSDDWRVYKELLSEHKDHLNQQALLELEKREFEKAFMYRIKAVEASKWLQLVDGRLADLRKKEKKED